MSHPNPYRFESLGSNCEFGFYQSSRGHGASTLFKWAGYSTLDCLQSLLDNEFYNLFAEGNTVPFNREVAIDTFYNVGWHAPFATRLIDDRGMYEMGNIEFAKGSNWASEWMAFQKRMLFLVKDFRTSIARVSKVLVLKDLENISDERIARLFQTLRLLGARASLMVVREGNDATPPGYYRKVDRGLIIVHIARFAPGHHVQTFCAGNWDQACQKALCIFDEETTPSFPIRSNFNEATDGPNAQIGSHF